MKKIVMLCIVTTFVVTGCSSKKDAAAKIAAGTPAYQLAKDLMTILPVLDPEKASVLVSATTIEVTAAEVVQMIQNQYGTGGVQLKTMDAARLKGIIEQHAVQLGERKLLLLAAQEAESVAPPEDVKAALDAQYAQAGGEAPFLEMLKTRGLDIEYLKKSVVEEVMIQKFLTKTLTANSVVTDAEIQKAYQEDKTASVRHILLLTQGKTEDEKKAILKKTDDILARAKKGEDFAGLAKQFSEDPGSKDSGGLYEDFGRGKMVKPFEDAAFTVPVGQISGIVETTYGYHILKVESRKKETLPYDQAKAQIEAQIKNRKELAAFEAYLANLKGAVKFKVEGIAP